MILIGHKRLDKLLEFRQKAHETIPDHHLIAHTHWCLFCSNNNDNDNDNDDDDVNYGDDDDGDITREDLGVGQVDRGQPTYY